MLGGLMDLQELNLYGDKISSIHIPKDLQVLSKLHTLNVGYNDLLCTIQTDIHLLSSLKILKVQNNFLEKVPMEICKMRSLKTIDASCNPMIQPPMESCERGLLSMRRYYLLLQREEGE